MSIKIDKPAICYETGLDEAFLVGTKEELSEFAHSILRLLNGPFELLDYHGINAKQPKSRMSLSSSMSEVVLDGIVIVESRKDRRDLMNKIRLNNGVEPIDWKGHDEWKAREG